MANGAAGTWPATSGAPLAADHEAALGNMQALLAVARGLKPRLVVIVDDSADQFSITSDLGGKVQRVKLLQAYLDGEFDAALAELEPKESQDESFDEDPLVAELEHICRDVAKDRTISADDNLFEVGVSSLTLTEVVLAIDEKYPGKLDISDLFDYPTLREIAAFLKRDT